MTVFDSNAILRYILQDNEEMADSVEERINQKDCFVPTEVIAEMVYVLSKVYDTPRPTISSAVLRVLDMEGIQTADYDVAAKALETYAATALDFVDCLMAGYQNAGHTVFTFDKALRKYLAKDQ